MFSVYSVVKKGGGGAGKTHLDKTISSYNFTSNKKI